MPKVWRWIAPIAVAGGLIAAGTVPAGAASTAYGVTINATSHYPSAVKGKVYGDALVIYRVRHDHWNAATISGQVTGAASGDVATLLAEPFGGSSFAPAGTPVTLTGGSSQSYSFTVTPSLATQYEVQVSTGSTVDATSAAQTVYVTEGFGSQASDSKTTCSHGHCKTSWKVYTLLPASAYKTEAPKRWYFYYALDPKLPRDFPRYVRIVKTGHSTKARSIKGGYEVTLSFTFATRLKDPARDLIAEACTKDTERTDGLGLPQHHGCGGKRLSTSARYVG